MTREPRTVQLYRPNVHHEPSLSRDILDICTGSTLLFVILWIVILVMGGL